MQPQLLLSRISCESGPLLVPYLSPEETVESSPDLCREINDKSVFINSFKDNSHLNYELVRNEFVFFHQD